MSIVALGVAVAVLFVIGAISAASGYAKFAGSVFKKVSATLPTSQDATALDRHAVSLLADRQQDSGLMLITSNLSAFAARVLNARAAERSLDLMYYMWNADLTGKLIMHEVIAAADRGVRVRLLLDDVGVSIPDRAFHAIDCHPNIELRLFNPTKARENFVHRGLEMLLRFRSVNRRMHNKAWITDGRIAIVGGRNIGDAYFDAAEQANFRDFDLVGVGQMATATGTIFDEYWNSEVALPVRALLAARPNKLNRLRVVLEDLAGSEAAKPYLEKVRLEGSIEELLNNTDLLWPSDVQVHADPPEKAAGRLRRGQNTLMDILLPVMTGARSDLKITSPYFIPGDKGAASLTKLVRDGTQVSVLTNSLAATDVAAVHGGYARYRKPLISGGVRLFELRPTCEQGKFSLRGSGQASLHTKAFTRDGEIGFIGSLNLDPRSVSLNTEMGISFRSPALVTKMNATFAEEISPSMSYAVSIDEGKELSWTGAHQGNLVTTQRDPDASTIRRMTAWAMGWLPLESQL